jgi:hypothetical protein
MAISLGHGNSADAGVERWRKYIMLVVSGIEM